MTAEPRRTQMCLITFVLGVLFALSLCYCWPVLTNPYYIPPPKPAERMEQEDPR